MGHKQQIYYNIDSFEQLPEGILIKGWAFSKRGEAQVYLCGDFAYDIKRVRRPDVAYTYEEREGLAVPDKSGFELIVYDAGRTEALIGISDGVDELQVTQRLVPTAMERLGRKVRKAGRLVREIKPGRVMKFMRLVQNYGLRQAVRRAGQFASGYQITWHDRFTMDRPTAIELEKQRRTKFAHAPLISLIVPVYNPRPEFLADMIESVLSQTYANWELILADGSTETEPWQVIESYAAKDKRLKAKRLEKNMGISGNTNVALDMAEGEYMTLLDHDDLLVEESLYEIVRAINQQTGTDSKVDFIYTDEDKVDENGTNFFDPYFKPDFSPELLETRNYICHLTTFSADLLKDAGGGFRSEYDGAQDFDLILRTTEKAGHIVHIPKILYHWRVHAMSTAGSPESKSYTHEAGRRALEAHLKRTGRKGIVKDGAQGKTPNGYKVDFDIEEKSLVSIIIPNYNHKADLSKCLESIWAKTTYPAYEIIIVENNSTEDEIFAYYDELEEKGLARVLRWPGIFNYAAINNWAAKEARGKYLLFLNNDIEIITPEWIEGLVMYAQFKEIGAVGAKLYYEDGTIQHGGVTVGIRSIAGHCHRGSLHDSVGYFDRLLLVQNVSAVTAALLLIRKEVFDEVGGFAEKYVVAFNDVDFCLRVHTAGYRNIFTPEVEAWHYESKSRGRDDATSATVARFESECKLFHEDWGDFVDPYYNKNLTLSKEDFSLK